MSRYIDAINKEYALASTCSGLVRTIDGEDWIRVSEVRESIMNAPTIDAVPVVRCRDCKWRHTMVEYTEEEVTSLDELDLVVKLRPVCDLGDDGFCSRGEKVSE